jgi:hypothetical protein
MKIWPSEVTESATALACIKKVPISNVSRDTPANLPGLSAVSTVSVHEGKFRVGSYLEMATTDSLFILSFPLPDHPK